ncbi:MAG TPA: type IV secretory system conjugative DNA transfer family protein [Solirubrobacteraceae bacterium]|nr:type IV secretory system conjugative DNA transfer family protein [Solirubrobacteraceae bacterium]
MSTSRKTDRELVWVAGVGVCVLAVLVGIEFAGVLGGVTASGHPVGLGWKALLQTGWRMFAHPGAGAWPLAVRGWLPANMAPALTAGAIVAAAVAATGGWLLYRLIGGQVPGAARWAGEGELGPLQVSGAQRGRVTLGRYHGRLIAAETRASTLVMGPTQIAGKTTGMVIPAVLEWQGPAFITGVKPDIVEATIGARKRVGEVKVFDPTGRTGMESATWSPIAASGTWTGAREVAAMLMQVGWEQTRAEREPHWRPAAARYLAPLLLAANHGQRTLEELLSWIDTEEKDTPAKLLGKCHEPGADRALQNMLATWKKDRRYVSSVLATLEEGLDAWQEPAIAAATSTEDITAEWLLAGSNTLYLIAPEKDQRRLANLFGALVMSVLDDALAIAATRLERRLDPALLCALEEVANIAPIPTLGRYAATGIALGVLLLTVLQDYAQAIEHWGAERGQSILAAHTCKLFCSGIADPATNRYIEQLLGQQVFERTSHHRPRGWSAGRSSMTVQEHLEPLAPPHLVRQHAKNTALLVYGRLPPAWIQMRPYFEDPRLSALAAGRVDGVRDRRVRWLGGEANGASQRLRGLWGGRTGRRPKAVDGGVEQAR